jgi:4'-phosphopantetheinyl transferase
MMTGPPRDRYRPGSGTVRVQIVPVDLPPGDEARCREVLDAGEQARAMALAQSAGRRRFTVAHGALRLIAGRELGVPPEALAWTLGPHGKPVLAPPWSRLHTSLSHTRDLVAVAVSTARPVGIDIEQFVPGGRAGVLAARFFLPEEAGYVDAAGDSAAQADRFTRLWVRKEAAVKSAGGRLWPNLRILVYRQEVVTCAEPASLCRVADVAAPAGHRAAVALAGPAPYVHEVAGWLPSLS